MPTAEELRIMQAYPLDLKVKKTQLRIREWVNYYGAENCAVSFSGGKDSTVLLHIVRELYPNMEAVFCNTTLEYPEIQKKVKTYAPEAIRLLYGRRHLRYGRLLGTDDKRFRHG